MFTIHIPPEQPIVYAPGTSTPVQPTKRQLTVRLLGQHVGWVVVVITLLICRYC